MACFSLFDKDRWRAWSSRLSNQVPGSPAYGNPSSFFIIVDWSKEITMSFARKTTTTHSLLSGVGMSAEYGEALNTLSNTTMKKAYQLLNGSTDRTKATAQLSRLLEQCKKAAKVVQDESPLPNLPTALSTIAPPASRNIPRGIVTKNLLLPPPNRRMSGMPRLHNTKRMKVERQKSDSSFKLKDPPEKKSSSAPPPSAMQFLAKLNKSTTVVKKSKPKEVKNSPSETVPLPPVALEESESEKELADDEELEEDEDDDDEEMELEDEDERVRPRRQPLRRESPPKPAGTPPSRRQPGRSSKK